MKNTITYSAVVALSLSLCSLGLSGCGESADSEPAQPATPTDGSGDKDAAGSDGSGDKDAAGSDEQAENEEDGL